MAARATFMGTNGPGWTCRPSSSATSAASARGLSLTLPPPSASGTSIENQPSSADLASQPRSKPSRSEEHTSELQSLMRISYAVFCLKKKKNDQTSYIAHDY